MGLYRTAALKVRYYVDCDLISALYWLNIVSPDLYGLKALTLDQYGLKTLTPDLNGLNAVTTCLLMENFFVGQHDPSYI